ncbi:MAG: hypothetical protein ACXWUS_03665 [Burkholderiales bacterium]
MSITPIRQPLPGEQVVGLSPESAAEAATVWLARPNLFPGRALTAPTLERRQRWQRGHVALRGQALTLGVVRGLEVGHEAVAVTDGGPPRIRLVISAGVGLAASGEDVVLARPAEIDLRGLPVFAEPSVETSGGTSEPETDTDTGPFEDESAAVLRARSILDRNLGTLFTDFPSAIPRIGVLVLQPVEVDRLGEFDPTDPCELSPCGAAGENVSFEDWRIADGVRAVWYAWPGEWRPLPPDGVALRNALAWTIFRAESGLQPGAVLPWEMLGVPVALIALDENLQPRFIDRASVVRLGGRARHPRLALHAQRLAADSRRSALWQAQIEQLAEQLAAAGDPPPDGATLAQGFVTLPPTGLLPTNAIDLSVLPLNRATERLASRFFPATFELDAAPIPIESLDLAVRESAPLAPLDMSAAERVRVLVPVPQALFEPRLLHEEVIDPEFQATLDRFLLARARALGARQGLRNKISELARLVTGRAVPVPAIDADPAALDAEALTPWGPPPGGGGHRSSLAEGLHQHFFFNAGATLGIAATDRLYAWIYLDPDHPPRVLMLQWNVAGSWEHRAYWAAAGDENLIAWGADGTPSRRRMGELPPAGQWLRVEVPAEAVAVQDRQANGMAFTLFDGRAAYGPAGRIVADGDVETPWFSNALPSGAVTAADNDSWTFLTPNDLNAPFEAAFGLEVEPVQNAPLGLSAGIAGLLSDPALAELTVANGQVTGGVLSTTERNQLAARGLEGFIAFLKSRADRADDLIDYGFVKIQTDTYRVRQLILGTTAATRLAVSPALAGIAQAETAVASQERISTFFDELKSTPAPVRASPSRAVAPARAARVVAATEPAGTISRATTQAFAARATPRIEAVEVGIRPRIETAEVSIEPRKAAVEVSIAGAAFAGAVAAGRFTPDDVVNAAPLVGKANVRTTSIAQRLEQPKALEAKDYATSTRHDAVNALLRLADDLRTEDGGVTPGLFAGVNVHGLANDPFLETADERTRRFVPFTAFIASRARLSALLQVPDREGDESAHFSDSADLADNTVALMRQMEGRVRLYREAVRACERVLEVMRADVTGARSALVAWDQRLAEARHDVSVTRALIADENERLTAINERRAGILRDEVRFLAYIRPRETHNLAATPTRTLDPGLLEAAIPACLREHADVPDELSDMLAVLREAPVAWFVSVPKLIQKLDRTDLLLRTVQSAQLRSQIFALKAPAPSVSLSSTSMRTAIAAVQVRQHQAVLETRQIASQLNIAQLASLTWQGARAQVEKTISLGDLIDGEHGRGEVSRNAAEAFDRLSRIATCLHAEFSAVLPSIRLDWAERLSQFDEAPTLRDLSVLARWSEIGYIDRKQIQSYVDWLFDQIDAREPRAESLMNDVVRMCLLLASEAPIGRILTGRLPRPVVVRPGVRIPLTAFDPARLRVGMHALVYRGDQVAARAVVEDIGSEISARVIHTQTAEVSFDVDARVQFAEAEQVTLRQAPKAMRVTKATRNL